MTTMPAPSSTERIRLVAHLTARRDELDALLKSAIRSAAHASDEPAGVQDFKELAAEESRVEMDDVALARAALARRQVMAALQRLDEGSYGVCLACGEAIDARRLEALPAAALCRSCQVLDERSRAAGR